MIDPIKSKYYLLLSLQVVFAFLIGIIGNKLAEAINLPLSLIIISAGILLTSSTIVAIALNRNQHGQENSTEKGHPLLFTKGDGSVLMLSKRACLVISLISAITAFIIHSYIVVRLSMFGRSEDDSVWAFVFTMFLICIEFGIQAIVHKVYGEPINVNTWQFQVDAMIIYIIGSLFIWIMVCTPLLLFLGLPTRTAYIVIGGAFGAFVGYVSYRWISP